MKARNFVVALVTGFVAVSILALVVRADEVAPPPLSTGKKVARFAGGCLFAGVSDVALAALSVPGVVIIQPANFVNWTMDPSAKYFDLTKGVLGELYDAGKEITHDACIETKRDLFNREDKTSSSALAATVAGDSWAVKAEAAAARTEAAAAKAEAAAGQTSTQ